MQQGRSKPGFQVAGSVSTLRLTTETDNWSSLYCAECQLAKDFNILFFVNVVNPRILVYTVHFYINKILHLLLPSKKVKTTFITILIC